MKPLILILAGGLAACAPKIEHVPVVVHPQLPAAPAECSKKLPSDLPKINPLTGEQTVQSVSAHWTTSYIRARAAYREARKAHAVCGHYASRLGKE